MKIGIAGLPGQTENYEAALRLAAASRPEEIVETEVSLSADASESWDALLLPGGGDIDPSLLPGSPPLDPACSSPDAALDAAQLALLDRFVHQKKPVLGICKGMQLIGLYFGANLCQHLPSAQTHRYLKYDQIHPTQTLSGSFLDLLYESRPTVNSAHHQGLLLLSRQGGGDGLKKSGSAPAKIAVIQWCDDGVIEGIVHKTLPVFGLQWHPERLCGRFARPDAVDGSLVFRFFLDRIRAGNRTR